MANANVVELEACIKDCLAFCEANPEHDFVQYFHPRLERAERKFRESVDSSDKQFRTYTQENIADKLAWKTLGRELKSAQRYLDRINAVGFPDETVLHWDAQLLAEAVRQMVSWLQEHADDIEEADSRIEKLERFLESAQAERFDRDEAMEDYTRHAQFRAAAFGTLSATLIDFRKSMRRALGKHSEDYRSIRWPFSLAPDRPII